jgi:hypothetical protein
MPKKIEVLAREVRLTGVNDQDYVCLTDIARYKDPARTDYLIFNWLRNRNTIEFLGLWEKINNPGFNPVEFDGIRMQAGLNSFTEAASTRPKGAPHASPGQRPGTQSPTQFEALKGRPNRCPDRLPASTHTSCSAPEAHPMDRAPQAPKAPTQADRRRSRESNPFMTRGPKVRPNGRTVGAGFQPSRFCETGPQGVALGWRKDGALPLIKTPIAELNAESAEVPGDIKELL